MVNFPSHMYRSFSLKKVDIIGKLFVVRGYGLTFRVSVCARKLRQLATQIMSTAFRYVMTGNLHQDFKSFSSRLLRIINPGLKQKPKHLKIQQIRFYTDHGFISFLN